MVGMNGYDPRCCVPAPEPLVCLRVHAYVR
jgi:hypothetical protein